MNDCTRARTLPLLNNIRIASPCSESWDGMVGDDRVRFCGGCEKNVYNLSAMTEAEAQDVIAENEGHLCVRLYKRKDGTVLTQDCEVGVRRKRVTKIAAAALAFGGAAAAFASMSPAAAFEGDTRGRRVTRGHTGAGQINPTPVEPSKGWFERVFGEEEKPEVLMGDISEPPPPPPPPSGHVLMGAVAYPQPPKQPQPNKDSVPKL
jgi:hypothetical protein